MLLGEVEASSPQSSSIYDVVVEEIVVDDDAMNSPDWHLGVRQADLGKLASQVTRPLDTTPETRSPAGAALHKIPSFALDLGPGF